MENLLPFFIHFLRFILHFKPTEDGIMVGGIYFVVYLTVIRSEITGAHHIVYSYKKSFLIIRQSDSSSCRHITVCQSLRNHTARIRDGIIIEITAQYNWITTMFHHILVHGISLEEPLMRPKRQAYAPVSSTRYGQLPFPFPL